MRSLAAKEMWAQSLSGNSYFPSWMLSNSMFWAGERSHPNQTWPHAAAATEGGRGPTRTECEGHWKRSKCTRAGSTLVCSQHPNGCSQHLSSPRGPNTFFWPPQAPKIHMVHIHICRQNTQIKKNDLGLRVQSEVLVPGDSCSNLTSHPRDSGRRTWQAGQASPRSQPQSLPQWPTKGG